jgi:hypothetical protein
LLGGAGGEGKGHVWRWQVSNLERYIIFSR